jgi:hypothetical protein
MIVDQTLIAARRKRIADEISDASGILAQVYAKKDFRRVGYNIHSLGRSVLLRGMMAQRVDGDAGAALSDFRIGVQGTQEFEKALEAIAKSAPPVISADLDVAAFDIPLFVCILAGARTRSREVALLTRDPRVLDLEDPVQALLVRLLAAFILDDAGAFQSLRAKFDRAKKSRWWQHFPIYVDMYEAVLKSDRARYHELAAQADSRFRARAKDKKFATFMPEYGGQEENAVVVDFMASAIAIVARWRNIPLPPDSDIVPHVLVEAASRASS